MKKGIITMAMVAIALSMTSVSASAKKNRPDNGHRCESTVMVCPDSATVCTPDTAIDGCHGRKVRNNFKKNNAMTPGRKGDVNRERVGKRSSLKDSTACHSSKPTPCSRHKSIGRK